jgi:hypothetical protein
MPTTITGYNTFAANTKARSSEVNENFSNHRSTLLPINADTQTASDLSHDLGSTEHRWRDIYADKLYLAGDTTAGIYFKSTSTGNSAFYSGNVKMLEAHTAVAMILKQNKSVSGGAAGTDGNATTSSWTNITTSTITCHGGDIFVTLVPGENTSTAGYLGVQGNGANPSSFRGEYRILKDSITVYQTRLYLQITGATSTLALNSIDIPCGAITYIDTDATAGTHEYDFQLRDASPAGELTGVSRIRLYCREW